MGWWPRECNEGVAQPLKNTKSKDYNILTRERQGGATAKSINQVRKKIVIDLTTLDPKTDEDNGYNNNDNDDDSIDNNDDDDDDSLDINNFDIEMKVGPIYSLASRALCEWDPEYWHGF